MATTRVLVPEVVQTSGMDCGPAALTCLLGGFGIRASYARLRDACQTDVDGTSIDAMQDAATHLGLDAQQIMLPPEHLALPEAEALPAIIITRQPGGLTHFVVVWRRHGRLLQVMDPAVGRRWVAVERFLDEVYVHELAIPADAFEGWARSDALRRPLRRTLTLLGLAAPTAEELVAEAAQAPGWEALARLDAAARMVRAEVKAGQLGPHAVATRLVQLTDAPAAIDARYWFARPAADEPDSVTIRGAVLVRALGRATAPPVVADLPADLREALAHTDPPPGRFLRERLRGAGRWRLAAAAVCAILSAGGVLAEAALFRALLSGGDDPSWTVAALVTVAVVLLVLDSFLLTLVTGVGRRLETGLRAALLRRLPGLPDRYVRSRPLSDLAERAHRLHRLRELPGLGADLVRLATHLLLLPVVIGVIDPASAVPAAIAALVGTAAGILLLPVQAERDLRLRSHIGAVARFYLDALVGLVAIRSHSAEPVIEGEHAKRLGAWTAAVRGVHRTAVTAELLQGGLGLVFVTWLLAAASVRVTDPATFLLLVYWTVGLPALGAQFGALARRYPAYRSATLRIIEPLSTPADQPVRGPASADRPVNGRRAGVGMRFADVEVVAGGQPVLSVDHLTIPAGTHVAVVGRSGSGKSTLAGLLLGWHTPARGCVLVDGERLDPPQLARLRQHTAWVDPTITVWNRSLAENLTYGADPLMNPRVIDEADLGPVLAALDAGLDEPLGEGGGLLSGGEAQRIRLGRARLRTDVRLAVLDEPFRGLDRDQRRTLLGRVRNWWPGATLLFTTHDVADTMRFDRVLVIDGGRIVEDGVPTVLAADPQSHLRALLDAEGSVAQMFDDPSWRHVRVARGAVSATAALTGGPQ